jgi:dienelactone hydrolase
VRTNAEKYSIDKDNICLWFYSGAGSFVAPLLSKQPEWLKCMVIYYSIMGPDVWRNLGENIPITQVQGLDPLPLLQMKTDWNTDFFIAQAGLDNSIINDGLQKFSQTAMKNGWQVEYWNHATGPHGFDVDKNDQRSKDIIHRTIDFLSHHLLQN